MIERFAEELKLVGNHEINVDFYRTQYASEESTMDHVQLGWHFDQYAEKSMVAVFHNDFSYQEGEECGLDIAENAALGPHNPLHGHRHNYLPKNGYISCSYPQNGAIIFETRQGTIIHRRSILNKPEHPKASRCVVQIKLKDPSWI